MIDLIILKPVSVMSQKGINEYIKLSIKMYFQQTAKNKAMQKTTPIKWQKKKNLSTEIVM